jgi:hypothetical protein
LAGAAGVSALTQGVAAKPLKQSATAPEISLGAILWRMADAGFDIVFPPRRFWTTSS